MTQRVIEMSRPEQEAHAKQWGGFNDFPPGWREIDIGTFARSDFFFYSTEKEEHRQMFRRNADGTIANEPCVSARLYFTHDNNGVAMVQVIERATAVGVKFYAFGCLHERDQPAPNGMIRCPDCGRQRPRPDSSD